MSGSDEELARLRSENEDLRKELKAEEATSAQLLDRVLKLETRVFHTRYEYKIVKETVLILDTDKGGGLLHRSYRDTTLDLVNKAGEEGYRVIQVINRDYLLERVIPPTK